MSVNPTFWKTTEDIKTRLRLQNISVDEAGQSIVEDAVLQVRSNFWSRLGIDRVAVLQGYTYTDNPVTAEENLNALARLCELKWVRLELAKVMPLLFKEGANQVQHVWNEEGAFRDVSQFDIAKMIERWQMDIDYDLELLKGTPLEEVSEIHASTFGPLITPAMPGDSIGLI